MAELERLKTDLSLEDAPGAGAPPPVPMATRPGAAATSAPPAPPAGKTARALYDYEAAEDNEIGFAEGELITQIEELDEGESVICGRRSWADSAGWWSGTNASGQAGLFPSNYCELIENEEEGAGAPPPPPAPPAPPAPAAPPAPPAAAAAARAVEEEEEGEVMIAAYE